MIRLVEISEENFNQCIKLKVREDQIRFVSSNLLSLAKAYVYRDIVKPFALYEDETMIGFIMLRFNEEYNNYFIWQFMIDERFQSKGYGKQALKAAIEWMRNERKIDSIVTTLIEGNEIVERLYTQVGFKRLGNAFEGEVDMELIL